MSTKRAFQRNLEDQALRIAGSIPAAGAASIIGPIDTGVRTNLASFFEELDAVVRVPKLLDAQIDNAETLTVAIFSSTNAAADAAALADQAQSTQLATRTFTGAGTGVAAQDVRCSLPTELQRYLYAKVSAGANTDAAGVAIVFQLVR